MGILPWRKGVIFKSSRGLHQRSADGIPPPPPTPPSPYLRLCPTEGSAASTEKGPPPKKVTFVGGVAFLFGKCIPGHRAAIGAPTHTIQQRLRDQQSLWQMGGGEPIKNKGGKKKEFGGFLTS